jgi:CMP-N-acetylneuraminic acid synthetase
MTCICIIGVRAGSKAVPGKNIRDFAGKPLLAHTIEQARDSGCFDEICVSSDSQAYLDIAARYGATQTVLRPAELASDTAGKLPAVIHGVETVEARLGVRYEVVVDLQVTTPLRLPKDIRGAIDLFRATPGLVNVFSVQPAHSSPYFTLVERGSDGAPQLSKTAVSPDGEAILSRQVAPDCYDMNGAVYVWERDGLAVATEVVHARSDIYIMPQHRSLDIDTEFDFLLAEHAFGTIDRDSGAPLASPE